MADENVTPRVWKDGEVITDSGLNVLEQNAANALNLARTNESDIDTIDHVINSIADDTNDTPALKAGIVGTAAIADGAATASKVKHGSTLKANDAGGLDVNAGNGLSTNATTGMLEVPIDSDHFVYGTHGIGIKTRSITSQELQAFDTTEFDQIRKTVAENNLIASTVQLAGTSAHSLDIMYFSVGNLVTYLRKVIGAAARVKQTATIPTTFTGKLSVSHLYAEGDGTLAEGVFDLTNATAEALTISAETAFATGLALQAKAATYSCLLWGTGDPLTLEVNATGKSVNFTTDVTIPASSTLHVYVRDNNG